MHKLIGTAFLLIAINTQIVMGEEQCCDVVDSIALKQFELKQELELIKFKYEQDKSMEGFKQKLKLEDLLQQVAKQKQLLSQFELIETEIEPVNTMVNSRFKIITEAGALYAIDSITGLSYKVNTKANSIKIGSQVYSLGLPNT